jgi:hypothetical protein
MSLSTIIHDISGLIGPQLISTLQYDLSGNTVLSTIIHDLSGVTDPSAIIPIITEDLSGVKVRILSINDLLNSHEAVTVKEAANREAVQEFTNPSIDNLRPALYRWASLGFPEVYPLNTLTLTSPSLCADGVPRRFIEYFEYLYGSPIQVWLERLDQMTDGMIFTFSHDNSSTITLHVTRT